MSWAEEDWTVGLSGRVLQKVKELQVNQERLSRENKQKQLQLDNIQTSFEKQTVKYEEVRGELQAVHRELQRVQDETKVEVTSRERLTQELQTKQAQVCSFEGQLDAARTLNNKLTQEVKRLEAELEKLQNSSRSADTTLFSTPCWNTTSPWEHNGNRREERPGHRDDGQGQARNTRQRLQFSDTATGPLPRQQHRSTPHHHQYDQSDSFSTPLAAFPWERDDSRAAARRQSPPSPQMPSTNVVSQAQSVEGVCEKGTAYKAERDALQSRVCALEEELYSKATALKSLQNEMVQSKKELTSRELSAQRARDELSLANTRMAQEIERASGAEQRLKQLQEELKCQRQNAESSRLQHQQRSKELEKQHQRDLTELQKERQCLEKQHQQEVNRLNQELQQARTLHNALQAQADKLSLQKQALDKEMDTLKEKLKWTEGQLQESQKKEAQTQVKLTEAVREAEGVAVCLEQSMKKERILEEQGRRLAEERADALHLLKELQEQKAAQPVQFCPVGQSFSPQPSYSLHSQLSSHIKRPTAAQRKEENMDKRRAEIPASYPSDREPGEGIDSEHITAVMPSECRRQSNEEENKNENGALENENLVINKHSTFPSSPHSVSTPTNTSTEDDPSLKSEKAKADENIKMENVTLRSELHDAREELQKRLEDLESQRRAEAEARTRLKQLSRKHASQSVEKAEQDREWRAQLESEKAETERVRKALAALEMEMRRGRESTERNERQEEEKNKTLEDRESEMMELNIQLKKQLAEVKTQLALEREERKREEERNQIINTDIDVKKELSMKLEELKAELEELKRSRKDDSLEEEKLPVANSPLTYLSLHDDELNSNMIFCDDKILPSPEQHLLFCQSINQHNMRVSTVDLIQDEQMLMDPVQSLQADPVQEDTKHNYLLGSDHKKAPSDIKEEAVSSDLSKELILLQKENAKEVERANQYQIKFEALQNQVTRQTQHLTMAFEKQSQHISGLLAELQEKERVLLSQGEELQHYKQELEALNAKIEGEEKQRKEEITVKELDSGEQKEEVHNEGVMEPNYEKECAVRSLTTNSPVVTSDAERPTAAGNSEPLRSGGQRPASEDSDKTQSDDNACVKAATESDREGGTTDMVVDLQTLQQQKKQKILSLTSSDGSTSVIHTEAESQEGPGKQSPSDPNDITAEARRSPLQGLKRSEDGGLQKEDGSTEVELEGAGQLQIDHLQQQVVELQAKIRSLSEETQQQAEELVVWRLASQPAPSFALSNTENQSVSDNQISPVRQSQSNQQSQTVSLNVQTPPLGVQESPGNVAIIREDGLLLSCSSSKLQSRMLFSRLQHSNVPEASKKTAALQEYQQNTAMIGKDCEKENQEIYVLQPSNNSQIKQKEKKDAEVTTMSSDKMGQRVTKDSLRISGTKQTKTATCHVISPEAKPDASKVTNKDASNDSSDRDVGTEMRSVSSQTEERLYARCAPTASVLICASTQTEQVEEEEEEEAVESPPVSPVPLPEGAGLGDRMLFSGSFPIPADPARLAERIRRNRTQLSAAFDDTEYEPYGLPEVVMKGFADIPSGPSCPYIVRRGLLGTNVLTVPQKNPEEEEMD